jgi:hypothetical protein
VQAVGPDSLATATAMPSMSAFVIGSRGSEHIGSVRGWKTYFVRADSTVPGLGGLRGVLSLFIYN